MQPETRKPPLSAMRQVLQADEMGNGDVVPRVFNGYFGSASGGVQEGEVTWN